MAKWDGFKWDAAKWAARAWAPGAVWRDQWRWWYQDGRTAQVELTDLVVEAQWSTDSYTMGDGTFRGDLQPGRLALRLYDRDQIMADVSLLGTIWARFEPTEATWCWFVHDVTSLLAAPGDPARTDVVVTADTWPDRLTTAAYNPGGRAAEPVTARLQYVVDTLNADTGLVLPAWAGDIASDSHVVPDVPPLTAPDFNAYPGWLEWIRTAAANGCAWLEARSVPAPRSAGSLVLHYDRWESVTGRLVYEDQYNALTPWTYGLDHVITYLSWNGTDAAGVESSAGQYGSGWGAYGKEDLGPMRVLADVTGGNDRAAVLATGDAILNDHGAPAQRVNQLMVTSGDRTHPDGTPSYAWDPASNVWTPRDAMQWRRFGAPDLETYRVQSTAHRLTARVWESVHTLEMFSQPAALAP